MTLRDLVFGGALLAAFGAAALPGGQADKAFAAGGPADCPAIGDTCADGTVYAGVSPDDRAFLFTRPADAPGIMTWHEAMTYAEQLDANGHDDWRLPTANELKAVFENRDNGALKGTFDQSATYSDGWYWSATERSDSAWMERFSGGSRFWDWKDYAASVRPVRSEPQP